MAKLAIGSGFRHVIAAHNAVSSPLEFSSPDSADSASPPACSETLQHRRKTPWPNYKTIALELIQEQPELYERLRSSKRLLPAMDAYAIDLKASHQLWKEAIARQRPGSDPSQIAAEALELAIQELQHRLSSACPADVAEPLSLDAAMEFLRRHSPTA